MPEPPDTDDTVKTDFGRRANEPTEGQAFLVPFVVVAVVVLTVVAGTILAHGLLRLVEYTWSAS